MTRRFAKLAPFSYAFCMRLLQQGILIIVVAGTVGCAIPQKPNQTAKIAPSTKASFDQLQAKELKRIDRRIEVLRRQELKDQLRTPSFQLPQPLNEDTLYAEVITSYRSANLQKLLFFQKELSSRFSKSVHVDNAVFLSGKLLFRQGQLARSLSFFHSITEKLLQSNKRPAALLMKARVYIQLNLPEVALATLQQLRKEYPGSPEFYQAEGEIQLIRKTMASG